MRLINFWYPQSIQFFITLWRNVMAFIEEDIAVNLMIRLLFVPMFHDSSVVGKLLSICFRVGMIILGCFGYIAASLIIIIVAFFWFTLPGGLIISLFFFKPLFWVY